MSGTMVIVAIALLVAVLILVSKMRSKKGKLILELESSELTYTDILKGSVHLTLGKASDTEELSVELKCVEKISYTEDGKEKTNRKTVFEEKQVLIGRVNHTAGHTEVCAFEFDLPDQVETTDLKKYHKPQASVTSGGDPALNMSSTPGNSQLPKSPSDFPSSELDWRVKAHLRSAGLDLYDTKSLEIELQRSGGFSWL